MLIVALVLAVVGLAALVTAVVTSNELVAWVCIAASVVGVILLIIDAIRERAHRDDAPAAAPQEPASAEAATVDDTYQNFDAEEYPEEPGESQAETPGGEPHPESEAHAESETEHPAEEHAAEPAAEEHVADEHPVDEHSVDEPETEAAKAVEAEESEGDDVAEKPAEERKS